MTIHIIAHERDRLLTEAERGCREAFAALDRLFERHLMHGNRRAPATFITRIEALRRNLENLAGHEALADLKPEVAAPPSCPDCRSPRVVDINAGCFGCAECGGLFDKRRPA